MIINRFPRSLKSATSLLRPRYPTIAAPFAIRLAVRSAASQVSSRPGSQSFPHGELNAFGEQLGSELTGTLQRL